MRVCGIVAGSGAFVTALLERGDDTVGNPHRAQIYQCELSELSLLLKLDKQLPVKRFEATVSQPTVSSPPLHCFGGGVPAAAGRHEASVPLSPSREASPPWQQGRPRPWGKNMKHITPITNKMITTEAQTTSIYQSHNKHNNIIIIIIMIMILLRPRPWRPLRRSPKCRRALRGPSRRSPGANK